ncbi:GNAT family N-acetyltransferase [Anaerotruncus rubiinfantis]|jgi:GNAT superfamily N-acetyltransferase|uniref:GNAT family N-acetyltransferase n=1 Tax=Anaerotruncus rubiinfantis TaxID=1720200 RepID=UPI00082A90C8|nr:GNAT family N-acetyltransferase [Anaerotruncus rubiinfantis]
MIQFAEESMRGAIRELWKECFGDSNAYVDLFLENHDICRQTMVFIDGVAPVAMLSLLPMTVVTAAGIMPARYIYAVATRESYRGRGISTAMLEAAHKQMKAAGVKLSVLVPATAELYNFYGKRGYDTAFYSGRAIVPRDQVEPFSSSFVITETTQQEFMQIRERAFAGRTMFVRWDGDALAYRMIETAFNGGETLTITIGDAQAVAVCKNDGGIVTVKELALDGMRVEQALAVLQRKYNADEYRLRLPMDIACPYPLERAASGAACWYDLDARDRVLASRGKEPYISLVLD